MSAILPGLNEATGAVALTVSVAAAISAIDAPPFIPADRKGSEV